MGSWLMEYFPADPRAPRFLSDLAELQVVLLRNCAESRKDHDANLPQVLYSTAYGRLLEKGLPLTLAASDWAAIVGYLLITLILGLYFRGRSGKTAAFLRGFRAVYLGLLMNCLILGWVTKAMVNIISTSMGISDFKALLICVFFLMPFTGIYVSLGGLWGVLWTDLFQFVLKMAIVISVAWYGVRAVGGMPQLLAKLAERRAAAGTGASDITALLPDFSRGLTGEALWTLPVITFVVHL